MAKLDFLQHVHMATKRDYLARVHAGDKAEFATIAKRFDKEYWDGSRNTGYGGYHYDGRWRPLAVELIRYYGLKAGDRVLDIGCGKGFLLYDLKQAQPGMVIAGLDISSYAIENSMPDINRDLQVGNAVSLPYPDRSFDLVLAINSLHNLQLPGLEIALGEINRVGTKNAYLVVDAYRTEREKVNLLYWQLTCECFFSPEEWEWVFKNAGYTGDYEFIYFP